MNTINAKVKQFEGRNGSVKNQFVIHTSEGRYFQSYESMIAFIPNDGGKVLLDSTYWDYSTTTGKYRNQFLGENKKETERKIQDGTYILTNLNS
jgi:hypothetical protein